VKSFLLAIAFLCCGAVAICRGTAQNSFVSNPQVNPEPTQKLEQYLRNLYGWGAAFKVHVEPFVDANVPGFYKVSVAITFKGQTENGTFYVTKDGRHLFRGEFFDLSEDPFAQNRKLLRINDRPFKGPADAKVTVVEFSDFECPHCRQMYQLWDETEPKYPHVRLVFENFPLSRIHPWAMTAALAGRCVYKANPTAFWKFHDELFEDQPSITPENAFEKMISRASDVGVPPSIMKECMASPRTRQSVEDDIAEGKALGVDSTPTLFINGHPMTGGDPFLLDQLLEFYTKRSAS
jgi:protein-disulfide isomerase